MSAMNAAMQKPFENTRANRLRECRENAGFATAADFIKKYDLVEPTYNAHESGRRNYPYDVAEKYAKLLGVELDYLWSGKSYRNNISSVPCVGTIRDDGTIEPTRPLKQK